MTIKRKKILLTNDDSVQSTGLVEMYRKLSKFADVTIIVPHIQRSGEGKAITLNKIIRIEKVIIGGEINAYTITGTSADAIIFGLTYLEEGPFDLVVSGINQGLNLSSHIILTSGTCAACFEASFYNVPAIAFSMDVSAENYFVSPNKEMFALAAKISSVFVKNILERKFPEKIAFLNVNYPENVTLETTIKQTSIANKFLEFKPYPNKDPRNNEFFFLWGEPVKELPVGSDLEAIFNGQISVSLVSSDLNNICQENDKNFLIDLIDKIKEN
ncbi:MAG TPA: 5'/3'-nucleotidase SurE [candidate division Zixibacteria bacterium]|nr:5'/3'-nucleotidase SurE [candidate division Zixibacteria bacterium]